MYIGTHAGSFHADDALGVAVLRALHPDAEVIRTRDMDILATCAYAVDVGGVYDPAAGRFDHHQKGFAERRPSGIPYAGAGLVWATFGPAYVKLLQPTLTAEQVVEVAAGVDAALIQHADAMDSGVFVDGPIEFGLSSIVNNFNGTWSDPEGTDDERFAKASELAGVVLANLVRTQSAELMAGALVRQAPQLAEGRILVLDTARLPYDRYVCHEMPDVLFVVYPESRGKQYQVRVVPVELGKFVARKDLPVAWAGLRDGALAEVTGVADAVFCHNGRFICGAASRESAIQLAMLALAE